jgi:cystathionine beta-lyase
MDFEDLERQVRDPKVTMAILCSPHNPVGRVWDREELQRFGKLCHSNDVLVVADEIHADLILSTHNFTPFATLGDADPARTIVCTAASKTFNLAGLHQSNIIIPDPELRARYNAASLTSGMPGPSSFGILALETAYNQGEAWLESVMGYIEANWRFLERTLAERIPQVSAATLEGTYLAWLDFRALDLPPDALRAWMLEEVRVYLDDGEKFGPGGIGFQRMNIACPRAILADALDRLARAAPRAARIAHDR